MNFNLIKEYDKHTSQIAHFSNLIVKYFPNSVQAPENTNAEKNILPINELLNNSLGVFSIVNFALKSYLYISPNVKQVLGRSPITFIEGGLIQSIDLFSDSQRNVLITNILPEMFSAFQQYSIENLAKDLRVSYTTLLLTPSGEYKWFLHQISVLETNDQGFPTIGVKHFTDIHSIKSDKNMNFSVDLKNKNGEFINIYRKNFADIPLDTMLSPRETELVQYLEMGFSAKQIADKMRISENTVNNHTIIPSEFHWRWIA